MKKDLFQEIEIPEGIEVKLEDDLLKVKGPEGENSREFRIGKIELKKQDNKIIVGIKNSTKKEKKEINSTIAHIKNMIQGVQKKFEYKLKICSSHFPINVEISGKEVLIKNFLGEKVPRKAKIENLSEVQINGDIINVTSIDIEKAGQTAANFELATKVGNRDRRIFQDGIFITEKNGRAI
jgi:large subunit ribosomal protein L6